MSPAQASQLIDRWLALNPPPPDWRRTAIEWALLEMVVWPWQGAIRREIERRILLETLRNCP